MLKHLALVYVVTTFLVLFCSGLPQRSGRQVAEDAKCIEKSKQMTPEQLTLLDELSEQKDEEALFNALAIETKSTLDETESKQSEEEMKIELAKEAESPCGLPAKTPTANNAIKPTQTVKQAKKLSEAMTTTTTSTTAKPEMREAIKEEEKDPKGTARSPTAGRMVFPSATAPRMSVDETAKTKTANGRSDGRIVFPKNDINSEEDDRLKEYKEYQMQLAKMSSTSTTTTPAPSTAAVDMPNISTQPPSGNATDPSGRNPKGGIEVVNRGIFDIAPSCKADEIYTNGACHRRA